MNESEYKRMEYYRGSINQFMKLYDWLKTNHPRILNKAIDAIQNNNKN